MRGCDRVRRSTASPRDAGRIPRPVAFKRRGTVDLNECCVRSLKALSRLYQFMLLTTQINIEQTYVLSDRVTQYPTIEYKK